MNSIVRRSHRLNPLKFVPFNKTEMCPWLPKQPRNTEIAIGKAKEKVFFFQKRPKNLVFPSQNPEKRLDGAEVVGTLSTRHSISQRNTRTPDTRMSDKSISQEGESAGTDVGRSGEFYPETARSLFDPVVRMANDEMALQTCRIFDVIARNRDKEIPRTVVRTADL